MRHGPALALLSIAVTLGWPCVSSAQDVSPQLTVRTADGQNTYFIGQRIPLELSFTGPDNKRYELNMAGYDRSGRMEHEKFEVTPSSGWADPLEIYFGTSGRAGGGMYTIRAVSSKPTLINLDLNEWVRFDQPGDYTIVVESRRVTDITQRSPPGLAPEPFALRSNPIRFHITPAPEAWQRAKLAQVVSEIDPHFQTPGMEPPQLKAAIADLRFLGTAAAARIMAQHVREDEPALMYQCAFGLIGLPEKAHPAAFSAMEKLVAAPDFPVSYWFLDAMSVIQLSDAEPEVQRAEREKLMKSDWDLLLQVLSAKRGKARAETAQTLSSVNPQLNTPEQKAELARILASSLKDLPVEKQVSELQWDWDSLRPNNLLSTLQQLAKTPLKDAQSNESNSYNTRELKSVALQRWYELDPEGAHEEVLRQIGSLNPSLNADALSFLPPEKLPQFESQWAEQLIATDDADRQALFAGLLVRFGTGSAVGLVIEKENSKNGEGVCTLPDTALGYLIKFDPESARPLAERAFKGGGNGQSGCRFSFQNIARSVTSPLLTEIALETLDDSDPGVIDDALIYLMDYGDESAEQPIWNRYVEWSEKWRGRADALETRQAGSLVGSPEIGVGENLARALIANQGWLATPDLMARVMEKCVGEDVCTQLKQIAERAKAVPVSVTAFRSSQSENYEIGQYSAKSLELLNAKVAQFPHGTRFSLAAESPANEDQKKLEGEVQALFEKNGMVLDRPGISGSQ